jgi:hypothetical protein
MTDADRAALKALVEKWRRDSRGGFTSTARHECADELSALIAAGLSEAPAPQEKRTSAFELLQHIQRGHTPFNTPDYLQCSCGATFWFPKPALASPAPPKEPQP